MPIEEYKFCPNCGEAYKKGIRFYSCLNPECEQILYLDGYLYL